MINWLKVQFGTLVVAVVNIVLSFILWNIIEARTEIFIKELNTPPKRKV